MKDLHLRKKDFKIDWFSGTGAGGQHRNKCQNTCRISHIATGLMATCGDNRERSRNLEMAFRRLADKVIAHYQRQDATAERPPINTSVIRTYHAADNRVKDHSSGFQQEYSYVVDGNHLGEMIAARAQHMLQSQV